MNRSEEWQEVTEEERLGRRRKRWSLLAKIEGDPGGGANFTRNERQACMHGTEVSVSGASVQGALGVLQVCCKSKVAHSLGFTW